MEMTATTADKELANLREELARCKADKEFVWSLWKQLQQDSPNITQAIGAALTREKTKQETVQGRLTATLKERDEEIHTLKLEVQSRSDTITKLEEWKDRTETERNQATIRHTSDHQRVMGQLNKATDEVNNLRSLLVVKETVVDQHLKTIDVLMKRAGMLDQELKLSKTETTRLYSLNTGLQETINRMQNNEKLQNVKYTDSVDKMHNEWEEESRQLRIRGESLLSDNNVLKERNRELLVLVADKEREIAEEKRLMKLMETTLGEGVVTKDRPHPQETLTRVERELHHTRQLLQVREEEVKCVRDKHDKRLERMRTLRESHDLVLEQLRTYDTGLPCSVDSTSASGCGHSGCGHNGCGLKYEDSHTVWNELSKYKQLCRELENDKLITEEQCDCIQVACSEYQSLIVELRRELSLERTKWEEEERREEGAAFEAGRMEEERREELEREMERLERERIRLMEDNRRSKEACHQLRAESDQCKAESDHWKAEYRKLKAESDSWKAESRKLKAESGNWKAESHKLRAESDSLQRTLLSLKDELIKGHGTGGRGSRRVSTSTMTDHIPTTQVGTSIDHTRTGHTLNRVWSSVSSLLSIDNDKEACPNYKGACPGGRRRFYSDGQVRLSPQSGCGLQEGGTGEHPFKDKQMGGAIDNRRHNKTVQLLANYTKKEVAMETRGQRAGPEHKCVWQTRVRTYQQRLKSLTKQVAVLRITRVSLSQELQVKDKHHEGNVKTLTDKNNALRMTVQNLRNQVKGLESQCDELRGRCEGMEARGTGDTRAQEDARKLKEEKKVLSEKVSGLSQELLSLQREKKQREAVIDSLQERVAVMERDLKQKRGLVGDQKKRLANLEEQKGTEREKISSLSSQVNTLQTSNDHYKQRVNSLKAQCDQYATDKKMFKLELGKCRGQLETTSRELSKVKEECVKMRQQISVMREGEGEREREEEYQLALVHLEEQVGSARSTLNQYKNLLMDLAREISHIQHRRRTGGASPLSPPSKRERDISDKARHIAQNTFQLTELEVDQLMTGGGARDTPPEDSESTLVGRVSSILHNNGHTPLLPRKQLLTEFTMCLKSVLQQ